MEWQGTTVRERIKMKDKLGKVALLAGTACVEQTLLRIPFSPGSCAKLGEQLKYYNPFCSRSLLAWKRERKTPGKALSFSVAVSWNLTNTTLKSHFKAVSYVFTFQNLSLQRTCLHTHGQHVLADVNEMQRSAFQLKQINIQCPFKKFRLFSQ